ncbi:MAG: M48 family metallopeptidase [Hydrogenophaga sp.]
MQRFVQLALDLFAGPDPLHPPVATPPPPDAPAEPLAAVFLPGTWHHPRANRLLRLGACEVAYEFKRGQRRTIGLTVRPEGLSVSAPRWTPVVEVEAFILQKSDWVLNRLRASRERAGELQRARTEWADGCTFDYLGQRTRLLLDPTQTQGQRLEPAAGDGLPTLHLGLSRHATTQQVRDAAHAWLMRQAKILFAQRLAHFAPALGVTYQTLRLSSAGTRWGSASTSGTIRLNWRLIHLSIDMIDYVVVHELSHLRHMDHSPQFWDVVASVMPDHAQRRRALRRAAVPLGE